MSNEQTAKALHIDGVQPFDCDGRKPNPVLINGERLSGMRTLSPGDRIRIGPTTLQVSGVGI